MSESLTAIGILVVTVPVVWWLMWRGWHRRGERQSHLLPLPDVPADIGRPTRKPVDGSYVSSTFAGRSLERVVAQDLGVPSPVRVTVTEAGVLVAREGRHDIWIAADALRAVGERRGQVGRAAGQLLVVLTWRHGDVDLDTAIQIRDAQTRQRALEAVAALTGQGTNR